MARNNPSNLDYENIGTTDEIILRTDGTSGRIIQSSPLSVGDSGNVSGIWAIQYSGPIAGYTGSGLQFIQYGV